MDPNNIDHELIDMKIVDSRRNLDQEFWDILVEMFFKDAPSTIQKIKEYSQSKNFTQLAETSHKLKGMAANLGAIKLNQISFEIESLAKEERNQDFTPLISTLDEIYQRTTEELKKVSN